ncbi:hypothetical protein K474DRAFT_1604027, partial [Panus rudis PR-1116 ss-1]
IREALSDLKECNISVGDLLLYVSDPSNYAGRERHEGLFKSSDRLHCILNLWVGSSSSDTARAAVHAWALWYMAGVLSEEGGRTTEKGTLRTRVSLIEKPTSESLSLESTYDVLIDDCPNTAYLLRSFCTTPRQERTMSEVTKKKNKILGSTLSILLSARSQQNSYIRQVVGLYLYASGVQRQVFSVLSHFGISCSYPTLVGRPDHADHMDTLHRTLTMWPRSKMGSGTGCTQRNLSYACRTALRQVVRDGETSWVYDNVNWAEKIAQQILGWKDSQTNGTCATAFPLFDASPDSMKTSDLNDAFFSAPPLSHHDIRLTASENVELRKLLTYTALRILLAQGGDRFKRFEEDIDKLAPMPEMNIPLHKTDIYPLPAMQIDESSTAGNAEVVKTIFNEAGFDTNSEEFLKFVRILWGDQLSVARLRSATGIRVGHDSPSNSMLNNVYGPGLFHYQLSACGAILEVHWGDPSTCTVTSVAR